MAVLQGVNLGAQTIRRNTNVEDATNDLGGAVEGLREAVEALEHHLSPLLLAAPDCAEGYARQKGQSELAERILSNADTIRARSAKIRELIERL